VVNKYFSVFAGIISFWIPASIMVYVYAMVYREMQRLQSSFKNGQHISLSRKNIDHLHHQDNSHESQDAIEYRKESLNIERVKFKKQSSVLEHSNEQVICFPKIPEVHSSSTTMTISNQERESRSGKIQTFGI
jgi:hypothetical protein